MKPAVVVVGGGPAGAMTAGLLARRGVPVTLLDAARFPRDKPCGDSVNPGAVSLLSQIGLMDRLHAAGCARLDGWRLHAGQVRCLLPYPPGRFGTGVQRRLLDAALLHWAAEQGVDVMEGTRVTGVTAADGCVTGVWYSGGRLPRRLDAHLVVGADGLHSVVAQRLGLRATGPAAPKVALTAHWRGIPDLDRYGELHLGRGIVCGIAPLGADTANVTVVMRGREARLQGRSQEAALRRFPGLWERFAEARQDGPVHSIGPLHRPVRRVSLPGAILVGDAAGYFDPLTGQGICRALRGGQLAAKAAEAYLSGDEAALPRYNEQFQAAFGPAERLQRQIDWIVRRPAAAAAGLRLLAASTPIGRWLIRRVGDCMDTEER